VKNVFFFHFENSIDEPESHKIVHKKENKSIKYVCILCTCELSTVLSAEFYALSTVMKEQFSKKARHKTVGKR
jgi:hypothetical protein